MSHSRFRGFVWNSMGGSAGLDRRPQRECDRDRDLELRRDVVERDRADRGQERQRDDPRRAARARSGGSAGRRRHGRRGPRRNVPEGVRQRAKGGAGWSNGRVNRKRGSRVTRGRGGGSRSGRCRRGREIEPEVRQVARRAADPTDSPPTGHGFLFPSSPSPPGPDPQLPISQQALRARRKPKIRLGPVPELQSPCDHSE